MDLHKEHLLSTLFQNWAGEAATSFQALPLSGSYREYFRIANDSQSAIGVYNADKKENHAFLAFTKHFLTKGLAVPEVYAEDNSNGMYLLQDLGDTTLFSFLHENRINGNFPREVLNTYKQAIESLVYLQIQGGKELDYSACYPRESYDQQSMMWDLNYFKYYFLKLAKIPFDEQLLEYDFQQVCKHLMAVDRSYFMYRDFQARNIMLHNEIPYFIDYQGGRKGALQYDLASLLFQAKANLPQDIREELLGHYLNTISRYISIDTEKFTQEYYGYVLIRLIQVLGAYGFRGFFERKSHFLESIPFAVANLPLVLSKVSFISDIPTLGEVLNKIAKSDTFNRTTFRKTTNSNLKVVVSSFSYKRGIPKDLSGNGGGFVFDCRSIHNPGRYKPYKHLTGRDPEVIRFLQQKSEINSFVSEACTLVDAAVEKYLSRGFSNLMVSFGCTGGQHRSVYSADSMAKHLENKYGVTVELNHIEQEIKSWINGA